MNEYTIEKNYQCCGVIILEFFLAEHCKPLLLTIHRWSLPAGAALWNQSALQISFHYVVQANSEARDFWRQTDKKDKKKWLKMLEPQRQRYIEAYTSKYEV